MPRKLFAVLAFLTALPLAAQQTRLPNPTITGGSTAFPGFESSFALDGNLNTDYASNGAGTSTFLDFDFGSPQLITQVVYTDRRTSGGGQGTFAGGANDNVSQFNLIFSTDSTFGNGDDIVVPVNSPGCCDTVTTLINGGAGYNVRFVRWQVTATTGGSPNNGAAEFAFFTTIIGVPALSQWMLLALASLLATLAAIRLRL